MFDRRQRKLEAFDGHDLHGQAGRTPGNRAPMVQIDPLPAITTVRVLGLNASRSTDPDGDPLTYQWRSVGRPAAISNANMAEAQVQFGGEDVGRRQAGQIGGTQGCGVGRRRARGIAEVSLPGA